MTLGEKIRKGSLWLMAGGISSQILQFVFGIILARLLLPYDFGLLVTVSVFTGIAGFFAGGGMGAALVRAKHITNESFSTVFTLQLAICLLLYLVFYFISGYFAHWFNEPIYEQLLKVTALNFIFRPFMNVPKASLQRDMRFKELAYVSFFTMLVSSCVSVILAFQGFKVWSLVIGGLCGSLFAIIYLHYITRWMPVLFFKKSIAKELGSFGVKLATNDVLAYFKLQITNFLISVYYGPGTVGVFNKGDSLNSLPRTTIAGSVYQTLFRALSTVSDDLDKSKYIFYRTITLQAVYITPFYVLLWWLAHSFIITVYGNNWIEAGDVLQVLSITGVLMLASPSGAVIEAQNKVGKEIMIDIEVISLLIAGIFLGLNWGVSGVVWAIVIVRFYNNLRLYFFASRLVDGKYQDLIKALIPGYILNIFLFLFVFLLDALYFSPLEEVIPSVYLFSLGISGGVFYFCLFLIIPFKELSAEQQRWKKLISSFVLRSLT